MKDNINCPVCNSEQAVKFLERKNVRVHQNYICDAEKNVKKQMKK